jgi:uncharacterized protein DUF4412
MKRKSTATAVWLALAAILVGSAQVLSAQDFTVRMKDQDGKTAVHYVSHKAVRNVSSNPVETDVIYRLDTGKIITLNHQQKTYTETTLAQAREQMEKKGAMGSPQRALMRRLGMNAGTSSITKIGAGEAIAGYPTDKYSATTTISKGELWVAPALEFPPGYYDIVTSYVAAQNGFMGQILKELKQKQVNGFLLKMVASGNMPMMKGLSYTQVATSVERAPIPPSTFGPPAGYRKVTAE